jgi:hypothetical protein
MDVRNPCGLPAVRPRKLVGLDVAAVRRQVASGRSVRSLAIELGVAPTTLMARIDAKFRAVAYLRSAACKARKRMEAANGKVDVPAVGVLRDGADAPGDGGGGARVAVGGPVRIRPGKGAVGKLMRKGRPRR